jgi:hypothetical protein
LGVHIALFGSFPKPLERFSIILNDLLAQVIEPAKLLLSDGITSVGSLLVFLDFSRIV